MRVFPPKTRLDNSRFGYLYGRKSSPFWLTTVVGASAAAPGRFCRNAPWPSITHTVTITATRTRMATHTSPVVHRCLSLGPISSARNVRSRLPVGHSRNRGGNVPVGAGGAGWRKDHRDLVREHARTSTFSTVVRCPWRTIRGGHTQTGRSRPRSTSTRCTFATNARRRLRR
jgi:hypothetical protein